MMNRSVFFFLGLASLLYLVRSAPLSVIDESLDDTAIVESTIREVRAAKVNIIIDNKIQYNKFSN